VQVPIKAIGCRRFASIRLKSCKNTYVPGLGGPFGRNHERWPIGSCHVRAIRVFLDSSAFARSLKPPLTIYLCYWLTMIGKSCRQPGKEWNGRSPDRVVGAFNAIAAAGGAITAQIG
jgi:hypothetical protein